MIGMIYLKHLTIIVKDFELNGIPSCFKVALCDSCVTVSVTDSECFVKLY